MNKEKAPAMVMTITVKRIKEDLRNDGWRMLKMWDEGCDEIKQSQEVEARLQEQTPTSRETRHVPSFGAEAMMSVAA